MKGKQTQAKTGATDAAKAILAAGLVAGLFPEFANRVAEEAFLREEPVWIGSAGDLRSRKEPEFSAEEVRGGIQFAKVLEGQAKNIDTGLGRTVVDNGRISGLDAELSTALVATARASTSASVPIKPIARSKRKLGRICGGSSAWAKPRAASARILARPCSAASFGFEALLTLLNEATLPNERPA